MLRWFFNEPAPAPHVKGRIRTRSASSQASLNCAPTHHRQRARRQAIYRVTEPGVDWRRQGRKTKVNCLMVVLTSIGSKARSRSAAESKNVQSFRRIGHDRIPHDGAEHDEIAAGGLELGDLRREVLITSTGAPYCRSSEQSTAKY